MSRLIDADALIEVIKESRPLNWTDSESELQEDADYNHFIEMVNSQPTAYDIEKVVAELESKELDSISGLAEAQLGMNGTTANICTGEEFAYNKAIEIVKAGGMK